MGNKVLITGITGMVGSHLAEFLLSEVPDLEVYGTKRWRSPLANIQQIQGRVQLIDCSLTDPVGVRDLISQVRPDFIFHLAANSFVPDSFTNPHSTIYDNGTMQLNIFEAVRACGLDPVIQVALSSEEYGKVYPDEVPITEDNPLRPLSPYAVSKVLQDMLAYQYQQSYGVKVIRTRAFNHEGPRRGEVFVTSNFAKQVAEIEAGLKPPVLHVGNLQARRDWTDVRDMVRAYWMAVNKCVPGEVYVIGTGRSWSVQDMVDILLGLTSAKIDVVVDPSRYRPSDVDLLHSDSTKFRKATGWEPHIPFEQTMSDLLDYWKERVRHTQMLRAPETTKH